MAFSSNSSAARARSAGSSMAGGVRSRRHASRHDPSPARGPRSSPGAAAISRPESSAASLQYASLTLIWAPAMLATSASVSPSSRTHSAASLAAPTEAEGVPPPAEPLPVEAVLGQAAFDALARENAIGELALGGD